MGIKGLTKFINDLHIYKKYSLIQTKLVIDGPCLFHNLFRKCDCHSTFGCDYNIFADAIKMFFNELLLCEIIPIVIMDGGYINKKHETIMKRYDTDFKRIQCFNMNINLNEIFSSPFMYKTIEKCLKELNIYFTYVMFEADDTIASLAQFLQCPVLSNDGDFFIYNVPYVPIQYLQFGTISGFKIYSNTDRVKYCNLYKSKYLNKIYPYLDCSNLPLISALLGNDYGEENIFDEFYDTLYTLKKLHRPCNRQVKIYITFKWLEHKSLNNAIKDILEYLPKFKHEQAIKSIQISFHTYTTFCSEILIDLGCQKEEIEKMNQIIQIRNNKLYNVIDISSYLMLNDLNNSNLNKIFNNLPKWFLQDLKMNYYSSFFINLFLNDLSILTNALQDLSENSITDICLPLIQILYILVTKGVIESKSLRYIDRNKNWIEAEDKYILRILETPEKILTMNLPTLHELRNLSLSSRKTIINNAMGITSDMHIEELFESWELFVGSIIYWLKQDVSPKRNEYHLYSITILLIYELIIKKLRVNCITKYFNKNHETKYQDLIKKRRINRKDFDMNISLKKAISLITKNDCLIAAYKIFEPHCSIDHLKQNIRLYNIKIVHTYMMFQIGLQKILVLNSLLGTVYAEPNIANIMKGTLYYNLFSTFEQHSPINKYVDHLFKCTPTILRVHNILIKKIKVMCSTAQIEIFKDKNLNYTPQILKDKNTFIPYWMKKK